MREESRALLDVLPVALYLTDVEGRITYYNPAAAELWGYHPPIGEAEFCGSWKLYHADGQPMAHSECPMALTLKEGRPIRGAEAIAERPDGTRVPFIPYPTPLFDKHGALIGAANVLVDIAERKAAERRFAAIIETSTDAIITKDLSGIVTSWNRGAEEVFGYAAEEVIGKSITILIPPDRHDEEPEILRRIASGERIDHYDTVRRRKDGKLIDVSLSISPLIDSRGRIFGASKIARDISDRRRAQDLQTLLLREMNHRIKNLFAVTSGLVSLSARSANTPLEMAQSVQGRLGAMTRAHELTRPGLDVNGQSVADTTLHALLRQIVAPHLESQAGNERVAIDGCDVAITGNAVTMLALVLHEFTTNAVKYGALSMSAGRVRVTCAAANGQIAITWNESGGPPLSGEPEDKGFGTVLTRRIVADQFGGRVSNEWRTDGLVIRVTLPLERLGPGQAAA